MLTDKLDLLRDILGDYYKEGADQYLFFCPDPKCEHHKRKLSVNIKLNVFKCWICGFSSKNIYHLIRRYGTYDQRSLWRELTGQTDLSDLSDLIIEPVNEPAPENIVPLPPEFKSLANNDQTWYARRAKRYLHGRGVTDADILLWKIGYADQGEYKGRIIIPSFNVDGKGNYFVARSFTDHYKAYKNPAIDHDIVFNELFVDWEEDVTLIEGPFDAITGGTNSIPILGSYLNEESRLFAKLVEHAPDVYVALDPDAEKKALRMIKELVEYGLNVFKVQLGDERDPGEMPKEEFQERKASALPMDPYNQLLYRVSQI